MKILAISGSIGTKSSNQLILQNLLRLTPNDISIEVFNNIDKFPFFDPALDFEGSLPPIYVKELRDKIIASNAVMIATPEYAHGIPGVLKNALDWLVSTPCLVNKSVGLIFGSSSESVYAESSLKEILKTMSANILEKAVLKISGIKGKFDANGKINNTDLENQLLIILEALKNHEISK